MENLDSAQLQALGQLRDLTNGGDDDVSIGVLASVDWDVQRAADMIFGTGTGAAPPSRRRSPSPPPPIREEFEVDDSEQTGLLRPTPQRSFQRPSLILSLLTYPLHVLSSIFRFLFGVLRIPLPNLPFLSLNFYRRPTPRRLPSTEGRPERWIRELEEETGAVCIGRSSATATSSGMAGPSTLSTRRAATSSDQRFLPDFTTESYEQTLKRCQKEARVACIILVSEEHDDVAEFKRTTLTDPTFVNLLTSNDFIVYGGDVRTVDAYSAAEKLNATTYPFVAFISPQPVRGASRSSSAAAATILSRHQGAANTTAEALSAHLTTNLIPRVFPYLMSRKQLERERQLREEQDRAFEDSKRRDTDRIRAKMDEEARRKSKEEEEARRRVHEEEERERRAQQAEHDRQTRMWWRTWMRKTVVPPDAGKGTRVAIRLPDGKRLVRTFVPERDSLTTLYAFVDTSVFIPGDFDPSSDPDISPTGIKPENVENVIGSPDFWGFTLATAYPRKEVPWAPSTLLKDVDGLSGGVGQLVVEVKNNAKSRPRESFPTNGDGRDSDGYETESDEE